MRDVAAFAGGGSALTVVPRDELQLRVSHTEDGTSPARTNRSA